MVVLVIISVALVADWYRTGIELVLCDLPIRPQARLRCLSLAAVHRMPKYGIQVPAALKHLRFVCGRSYRNEVGRWLVKRWLSSAFYIRQIM